jgi:hypothetical protein
MAKKTRKKTASKAGKKIKALTRKKAAKKKIAVTKKSRKAAAAKKSKPVAKKTAVAKTRPAATKASAPPPESLPHKIAGAFTAVVDILTDAERLHHKLDPGISNEPE